MTRLKNKVAVITGGSGGIGLAAGKIFALEGAKVLLVDVDDEILRQAVKGIGSDAVDYTVAALMLFLAGDESRYCTGGVYMVDGGLMA